LQGARPTAEPGVTIFTSDSLAFAQIVAALGGAGCSVAPARVVRRTVLESFDGRLFSAGLRLEVRELDGYELILTGKGMATARVASAGVPRLAGDLPAGPFRSRLAEVLGIRALLPMLTLTAREATGTMRDRKGKARVSVTVHERLTLENHGAVPSACAVEVFPLAGYDKDAAKVRDLLVTWGLEPSAGDPIEDAATRAGIPLRGFTTSPSVPLRRSEPALEAFRRLLANLAETVDATWQGTLDDVDPEFLHDLRVAVRRTRSVLSQGNGVLPPDVRGRYGDSFRWLGGATGRPRDLDVYVIEWDEHVAPLGTEAAAALAPALDHIVRQRRAAHAAMCKALRSARYRNLMSGWHDWLHGPAPEPSEADAVRPIGEVVAARTDHAQRRLLAHGRAIGPDSPAGDLHELRKDAKKLRYLLECFGSLYPSAERKAFVQILKVLQDNLGEHQDAEVHVGELRTMPAELHRRPGIQPATMVAVGQLTEQLERRRRAARDEFAGRFATYDTKHARKRLQKLLRAAGGAQ